VNLAGQWPVGLELVDGIHQRLSQLSQEQEATPEGSVVANAQLVHCCGIAAALAGCCPPGDVTDGGDEGVLVVQ
jgi:hypothetical protein